MNGLQNHIILYGKPSLALVGAAAAAMALLVIVFRSSSQSRPDTAALSAGTYDNWAAAQAPPSAAGTDGVSLAELQQGLSAVVSAVRIAVVSISANREIEPLPMYSGVQLLQPFVASGGAVGSGVIVDPTGLILTSRQVTGEADTIKAALFRSGRNTLMARRVAADPQTDLVLYQLPSGGRFPFAMLGDSSRVRTGDIVIAIGSPFGLSETVTHGIVSTRNRSIIAGGRRFDKVIQTDAAINEGNCGGPLVDIEANVIGINLAIYSTDSTFSGIGFAIPSNQASFFIQRVQEQNGQ